MNTPNTLQEKILELFNKLPFSDAERRTAEDYLSGKAEHKDLNTFSFTDLSTIPADPAIRVFRELIRSKNQDMAAKIFSVLLAKGDSTCFRMIPMDVIDPEKGATDIETDSAKKAAVYANILGTETYPLGSYSRDRLIDIACGKAEILKQALDFEKSKSDHGKFVLYAAYFMRKYKCGDGEEKPVEAEDLPLLARYEEIAIENLDKLFPSYHPAVPEIKDAVQKGEVTEQILELAGSKRGISKQTLRLLVSMAYLNYPLSEKLKDIVKICLAAEMDEALDAINLIGLVTPMDIYTRGGAYDKEFALDSRKYITWTAKKGHTLILEKQFENNTELYIKMMEDAEIDEANKMLAVIKKKNPSMHEELVQKRKQYGYSKEIEKLLKKLVQNNADAEVIKAYLRGETAVDTLYPLEEMFKKVGFYGGQATRVFDDYGRENLDKGFYRRFQTYMWLRRNTWFFRDDLIQEEERGKQKLDPARVMELFQGFAEEGLDVAHQLSGVNQLEENLYPFGTEVFHPAAVEVFRQYLKDRREETIRAFAGGEVEARRLGLEVLSQDIEGNKKEILAFAEDGAKAVKQAVLEILCRQTGWMEEIKGLLISKKAAARELAVRVLASWQENGMDCQEVLAQAMEKEKNAKVKVLMSDVLGKDGGASAGKSLSQKELVQEIHKGGRKRSLAWAYESPFSVVHTTAGEKAEEEYLQAILLCYSSMEKGGYNKNAEFLAKALHTGEFAVYVNELFDKWMEAGAEAKKRWVLYAAAIHGGNEIIVKLMRQIKEWSKEARGAIACDAVRALSLSPLPEGLLSVDGIARKFKHRQVRMAANEALEFAAEQLGISRAELEDRIIPDFGFDEELGRTLDYGERKFRVMITAALEVEVFEEIAGTGAAKVEGAKKEKAKEERSKAEKSKEGISKNGASKGLTESAEVAQEAATPKHVLGKKLKNLPAPGKRDDEKKAAAAYEEFKQMKKQMKTVASSQKLRLEQALSSARLWSVDAWKRLFVKNPVMHQFAIGLIWGVYGDGKLVQCFRYMEDGSFNTKDEEEYFLPEDGNAEGEAEHTSSGNVKIGLVHPIELTKEELELWKQQLEDYEITQPFAQLERDIFMKAESELTQRKFSRFTGRVVNDMTLGSRLIGFGWYRGPVLDGGCVETYYREDVEIGFGAELHFSGCFAGYLNEDVTIYSVRFYKIGEVEGGCCLYEKDMSKICLLRDVPEKYFSEVVMQVEKATSSADA